MGWREQVNFVHTPVTCTHILFKKSLGQVKKMFIILKTCVGVAVETFLEEFYWAML